MSRAVGRAGSRRIGNLCIALRLTLLLSITGPLLERAPTSVGSIIKERGPARAVLGMRYPTRVASSHTLDNRRCACLATLRAESSTIYHTARNLATAAPSGLHQAYSSECQDAAN